MRRYAIFSVLILLSLTVQAKEAYIENKGQIIDQNRVPNAAVLYLYNGNGLNVQLRRTGFSYDVWTRSNNNKNLPLSERMIDPKKLKGETYTFNRIDLDFVSAAPSMTVVNGDKSADYLNYYTEFTGTNGITHIHHYGAVTYKNVWQGIDIEFSLNAGHPKYNFIVHSGAKLSDIKLAIKGANNISVTNDGLELSTNLSVVKESVPNSYFIINDIKTTVTANFVKNADGTYGIQTTSGLPSNATLVIDPLPNLLWGSYHGVNDENSLAVGVDKNGKAYFGGWNADLLNVATAGAFQDTLTGSSDAYIVAFNKDGGKRWGTYYGGPWLDYTRSFVVDSTGQYLYLCGYTMGSISVFGTAGTFQPVGASGEAAFLSKFDSTGTRIWGTYFDTNNQEEGYDVAQDDTGNIYMVGYAHGTGLGTSGTFQPAYGGGDDGFIAKFNPANGTRVWCTYYGGTLNDELRAITIRNGYIYAAGKATSSGLASTGAYQTTNTGGGDYDMLITKFDLNGNRLWATYYGNTQQDETFGIAADNNGVYLCGRASSANFTTPGAYLTINEGAYLLKFDASGNREWSTRLPGYYSSSVIVDKSGNIDVTGPGADTAWVATPNAFHPTPYSPGLRGSFIMSFTPAGQRIWGTYYGAYLELSGLAIDGSNNLYVTGAAADSYWVATPGTYQSTFGGPFGAGQGNATLSKFTTCPVGFATAGSNSPITIADSLKLFASGGQKYSWTGPNNFNSNLQNPVRTSISFADGGIYTVTVTDTVTGCSETKQVNIVIELGVKNISNIGSFSLYPNPNSGIAQIDVDLKQQQKLSVIITDITGRTMYAIKGKTYHAGKDKIELDMHSLTAGSYICRLVNENGHTVWSGKIVRTAD